MESFKITYGIKEDVFKRKRKKYLTPLEKIKIKRRKAALEALLGIWEDKDTSFFDKR